MLSLVAPFAVNAGLSGPALFTDAAVDLVRAGTDGVQIRVVGGSMISVGPCTYPNGLNQNRFSIPVADVNGMMSHHVTLAMSAMENSHLVKIRGDGVCDANGYEGIDFIVVEKQLPN